MVLITSVFALPNNLDIGACVPLPFNHQYNTYLICNIKCMFTSFKYNFCIIECGGIEQCIKT